MNIFTSGYELITALTNVVISFVALYFFIKLRKNTSVDKLWPLFFVFITSSGILGTIIHGINFSDKVIKGLWVILAVFFCLSLNTLMVLFLDTKKKKYKKIIYLSIFVYSFILIEMLFKIDFLLTFILYSAMCLLFFIFLIIKKKYNKYFFLGILSQIIGGIFLLNKSFKINFLYLDKNGIYHLFMVVTLIFFYKGIKSTTLHNS